MLTCSVPVLFTVVAGGSVVALWSPCGFSLGVTEEDLFIGSVCVDWSEAFRGRGCLISCHRLIV